MPPKKIKLPDYIAVMMDCRHIRERRRRDNPQVGDMMWCLRCHKDVSILKVIEEFRIKCMTCRYGRLGGTRVHGAATYAVKHHRKNPSHEVLILRGLDVVKTFAPQAEKLFTEPLPPGVLEVPPF